MKRVILLAVTQAVVLFFIIKTPMPLKATSLQLSSGCLCAYCRCLAFCDSLCDGDCST